MTRLRLQSLSPTWQTLIMTQMLWKHNDFTQAFLSYIVRYRQFFFRIFLSLVFFLVILHSLTQIYLSYKLVVSMNNLTTPSTRLVETNTLIQLESSIEF